MRFLVDAQLPRRLAVWLADAGYDTIHTLDLPQANRTPDSEICRIADDETRIVVTKDDDFVHSFLVQARPRRLLLVSTGNIVNSELLAIFRDRFRALSHYLRDHSFVELTRATILYHD